MLEVGLGVKCLPSMCPGFKFQYLPSQWRKKQERRDEGRMRTEGRKKIEAGKCFAKALI